MAIHELSALLWRERELLDVLTFKLEEEQLLLTSGKSRWLPHGTREVEQVLGHLAQASLARTIEAAVVAEVWGLPTDASLAELAAAAPEGAWAEILTAHLDRADPPDRPHQGTARLQRAVPAHRRPLHPGVAGRSAAARRAPTTRTARPGTPPAPASSTSNSKEATMSTFGALNTAYRGLTAAQQGMNVAGQNIANAATEGYTRQRVDQSSLAAPARGLFSGGALAARPGRVRERHLPARQQLPRRRRPLGGRAGRLRQRPLLGAAGHRRHPAGTRRQRHLHCAAGFLVRLAGRRQPAHGVRPQGTAPERRQLRDGQDLLRLQGPRLAVEQRPQPGAGRGDSRQRGSRAGGLLQHDHPLHPRRRRIGQRADRRPGQAHGPDRRPRRRHRPRTARRHRGRPGRRQRPRDRRLRPDAAAGRRNGLADAAADSRASSGPTPAARQPSTAANSPAHSPCWPRLPEVRRRHRRGGGVLQQVRDRTRQGGQ